MTISEVLEELRWVDRDVYETLRNYPIYCSVGEALTVNLLDSSNQILVEDAIQGSIQRACERRGWPLVLSFDCDPDHQKTWVAKICDGWTLLGLSAGHASPAEALLAAYIAAVRAEAKR